MPIDARIALGVEPVKMPDFAQLAVQRSAVMNNMAEMASKQRALNEQNTLAQLMQDPSFDFNNPESINKLSRAAPNLAPVVVKNYQDYQTAQAEAKIKALAYADAQTTSMLTELFSHKDFAGATSAIDQRVANGQLTPEQGAAAKAKMGGYDTYDAFAAAMARSQLTPAQKLEVTRTERDLGGSLEVTATPTYGPVGTAPVTEATYQKTPTPGDKLADARARESNNEQSLRPLASVGPDGSVTYSSPNILNDPRVNPTGASSITIAGIGKPSGGFEAAQKARGDNYRQITTALPIIDELLKPGSNLDKAKGGLIQALINGGFGAVGITTPEAAAQAKLGPQGFGLLIQVPRFEGPQGVLDVKLYETAAGKLTDPFATAGEKRAALETIKEIMLREKAYLDANPQVGASKTGPGGGMPTVDSQAAYDALAPGTQYRDSQGNIATKGGG